MGAAHIGIILNNDHFLKMHCILKWDTLTPYPKPKTLDKSDSDFMLIVLLSDLSLCNPASASLASLKVDIFNS